MKKLLVVGAGGHGKVVADSARDTGLWNTISFLDDHYPGLDGVNDLKIIGRLDNALDYLTEYSDLIVAIGDNEKRLQLIQKFKKIGFKMANVIHPRAFISKYVEIGEGTVVLAQSAINAGASIGSGCIVNTGSIVEHDCNIGEGVHISPGARLAGNVRVGDLSWIGIGASVIQHIHIGRQVIVGAGSVIIQNIGDNSKVVGVPGKVIP